MRRSTSARSRPAARRSAAGEEAGERPPLLGLQHLAGNRAVSALVARDSIPWRFSPTVPKAPDLRLPADYVEKQADAARARVRDHLQQRRETYEGLIRSRVSIAELMDRVYAAVPEARTLGPADVEATIRAFFRPLEIATHREPVDRAGAMEEIAAMARNALGPISKGVRVGAVGPGSLSVGISGLTAAVGPEGDEKPLQATLGWDRSVKLTTRAPGVLFEATISPPAREGGDIAWEIGLQFPGEDAMVPLLPTLPGVFSAAEKGIREAAGEARRGGPGSFDRAKQKMAPVKDAVSAVSSVAAKHTGPRFGITAQGEGGEARITATLTIVF